jgi:F0F1-type ATP synthase membrane subunit b/b'
MNKRFLTSDWLLGTFFEGDKGGGGGEEGNPADPPSPEPEKKDPPASKPVEFSPEQEALVNKRIEDERKKATKEAEDKIKADAKRKQDEEAGRYRELYEQEREKTTKLEEAERKLQARNQALMELIDGEIAEWPASVRATDPGKDVDFEVRKAWLESHREIVKELAQVNTPPNHEMGDGSKGKPSPNNNLDAFFANKYPVPGAKAS